MNHTPHRPLRLGFIGGAINSAVGYAHYTASTLDKRFELVTGCFSRNPEINAQTGMAYGIQPCRVYKSWRDLIQKEKNNIDALAVLTPTPMHTPILNCALENQIPLICEKALTTSLRESLDIEKNVTTHAGFLAVTYNYTGYPMVRELREMIKVGRLGTLQQIHVEMPQEGFSRITNGLTPSPQKWRLSDAEIPTVSLDLGVHAHHLVEFLGAGEATEVVADHRSYGLFENILDDVSCIAHYPNNVRVNYWYGKSALGYRNGLRIRIFGSKASAEWVQAEPEEIQWNSQDGRRELIDRGSSQLMTANSTRYTRFKAGHPAGFIEAFANLYTDIADLLASKEPHDHSTYVFGPSSAARGLAFLEAVHRSAQNGKRESIARTSRDLHTQKLHITQAISC